jgi:CheY-like chemotaxis protein
MDKVVNILIVEDDALDVINIQRSLDKMGIFYQLHTAKNGEEAIKALTDFSDNNPNKLPDFVLIDINMPRMNGIELLTQIRQNEEWKHLKCFIITTSDEKNDHDAAKKLGISGYIIKPLKLSNPSSMDAFNLMIDLLNTKA